MLTTVPTGTDELGNSGLGIFKMKLSNGESIWGHGGTIPGFLTFAGGTLGGKHTLVVNLNSLKADTSDPFKIFYLLNLASRSKGRTDKFYHIFIVEQTNDENGHLSKEVIP